MRIRLNFLKLHSMAVLQRATRSLLSVEMLTYHNGLG